MGDLISLSERCAGRARPSARVDVTFFFDLACPFSYLAAEQVQSLLGVVAWAPVAGSAMAEDAWTEAEGCAEDLRLPLVWPDCFPSPVRSALRAAAYAAEVGAGDRFALAASRLAFCGGFDIEDPEMIAEAAAAAVISLDDCLAATNDPAREQELRANWRELECAGVRLLPAIRAGNRWFEGVDAPVRAATLLRPKHLYEGQLAPVG